MKFDDRGPLSDVTRAKPWLPVTTFGWGMAGLDQKGVRLWFALFFLEYGYVSHTFRNQDRVSYPDHGLERLLDSVPNLRDEHHLIDVMPVLQSGAPLILTPPCQRHAAMP